MARRWSLLGLLVVLANCGGPTVGDSAGQRGSNHAVLAPGARALDAEGIAALTAATADGRLIFSSFSPVLQSLRRGDVLIIGATGPTPLGALRKIANVSSVNGEIILETEPARFEEAFEELKVNLNTSVEPSSSTSTVLQPRADGTHNGITFPFSLAESGNEGAIGLDGSIYLAPEFGLELSIDYARFALDELSLKFGGDETFVAGLTGVGQASIDESIDLGAIEFAPIILTVPTPAGPIPLVLTPGVTVSASLTGSIQGQVDASVSQQAGFSAGLGYINGSFQGISDSSSSFNFDQPSYESSVNLKAAAGPRFEVLLYGAVGPFASAEAYVELGATAGGPPPCASGVLDAGLAGKAGVQLIADYETTLFNKSYPLASFDSCSNDPGAPRPALTWARSLGRSGSAGERAKGIIQLSDGTYIVVGDSDLFDSVGGFAASLWAMRLDALGNVMWQKAFGRQGVFGIAQGAAEVPGGIVVAASSGLMKLDIGGNLRWATSYDSGGYLEIKSVAVHADGGIIVAGSYGTSTQAWAMKLDAEGQVQWSRRYGGEDFARVRITEDGGYILVGLIADNENDVLLAKLDDAGNVEWKRSLDNHYDTTGGEAEAFFASGTDRGFDVAERPGGGYVVAAESYGSFPLPEPGSVGYYAPWIVEVDEAGELVASRLYRSPVEALYGSAYAVAVRPNGAAWVVGRRADTAADLLHHEDVLLIRDGAYTALGGAGNDTALASGGGMPLQLTQDGGAILAATSDSFAGSEKFWVVKLDRTGGVRFPYSQGLSGSSYANDDALSMSLYSGSEDAPITVVPITAETAWEVTDYEVRRQTP